MMIHNLMYLKSMISPFFAYKSFIQGVENKLMDLYPYNIRNEGPHSVNEYVIENWILAPSILEGSNLKIMKIAMILSRKVKNIFLVTYLPTVFMNLINQATNYVVSESRVRIDKETRSGILQGQALFTGLKQLRRCLVMLNNFEKFSFPLIEKRWTNDKETDR